MISNRRIHILGNLNIDKTDIALLTLGIKYIPKPSISCSLSKQPHQSVADSINNNFDSLYRHLTLKHYFKDRDNDDYVRTPFDKRSTWVVPPRKVPPNLTTFINTCKDISIRKSNLIIIKHNSSIRLKIQAAQAKQEIQRLKVFLKRTDISIIIADKNLGVVILPSSWERQEHARQLDGNDTYSRINSLHHLSQIYTRLKGEIKEKNLISRISKEFGSEQGDLIKNDLKHFDHAYIPKFYLLIKIHKTLNLKKVKGRPITGAFNAITAKMSIWVDYTLQPTLVHITPLIKDTPQMINNIQRKNVQANDILFVIDVESLYTNISTTKGLSMIRSFLTHKARWQVKYIDILIDVLRLVLTYSVFKTKYNTMYRQRQGTSMGTQTAPPYANIFVYEHERTIISTYDHMIYYARFLDDIFGIWRGSLDSLLAFKLRLQTLIGINLTIDHSTNGITMLDCFIYKGPRLVNNQLDIRTYIKPTNLFQYITYNSFHPKSTLKSLVVNQLQRFVTTNTERKNYIYHKHQFYKQLQARGYHHDALQVLFNSITYGMRDTLLRRHTRVTSQNRCIFVTKYTPLSKDLCFGKIFRDNYYILQNHPSTNMLELPLIAYSRCPNVYDYIKKFSPKNI